MSAYCEVKINPAFSECVGTRDFLTGRAGGSDFVKKNFPIFEKHPHKAACFVCKGEGKRVERVQHFSGVVATKDSLIGYVDFLVPCCDCMGTGWAVGQEMGPGIGGILEKQTTKDKSAVDAVQLLHALRLPSFLGIRCMA